MATINNVVTGKDHAIVGVAEDGIGTHGTSRTSTGAGGVSGSGIGVHGVSNAGPGVRGDAENGVGVFGASQSSTGTGGVSDSGIGVHGISQTGDGVFGVAEKGGRGVVGVATTATGVEGRSTSGTGVWASSDTGEALHAESSHATAVATMAVFNNNSSSTNAAVYAKKAGTGHAGFFDGNVHITGNCEANDVILHGADVAEQFDLIGGLQADPGCVVVLAGDDRVRVSDTPYDRRVAGIVSGAGSYRPALVLHYRQSPTRRPLALTGKVWCMAEADTDPIEPGDLLTTSSVAGHAMRASDQQRAFGAVVGKALSGLPVGRALIPVLVALQ